jgi:hypothetical protein
MELNKWWRHLLSLIIILFLAACSSQSQENAKSNMDMATDSGSSQVENSVGMGEGSDKKSEEEVATTSTQNSVDRMVIYKADIRLRVKNFEKAQQDLEMKAKNLGGFIVQSNVYRDDNEQMSGTITLRIPGEHFQRFLHDAEGMAEEVIERNVNGQDVTEEYVDLESRLRSKRAVEERLLEFMKNAQKTEDLLKISNDLAGVQEEIEQVLGRMKFLENQTSLSTISISLFEENVIVPNIEKDDLDTWEKTKKQFVKSTNFLLSTFSSLFVFFVGNLPVLILFSIFLIILFFGLKKYISPAKSGVDKNTHKDENK